MTNRRYSSEEDTGANYSGAMGISEHTVIRTMAGEVETIRLRLADALEQLGYRVLDEMPLRARHGARGSANYYLSANALDYPTTLEIGLKQQSAGSTRVTFDYSVVHGNYGKGDRQSLTREAEALIALAMQRSSQTSCIACGTESIADSRFCRKCGAPTAIADPAELEVMRLTANVRAGHQWAVIGLTILAFGTMFPLLISLGLFLLNIWKGAVPMLVIAAVGVFLGGWALLAGILKTHYTLNPRGEKEEEALRLPGRQVLSVPRTNELELESVKERLSITEGTTDLLNAANVSQQKSVPVYRKDDR